MGATPMTTAKQRTKKSRSKNPRPPLTSEYDQEMKCHVTTGQRPTYDTMRG